jgi:hypothetical protein
MYNDIERGNWHGLQRPLPVWAGITGWVWRQRVRRQRLRQERAIAMAEAARLRLRARRVPVLVFKRGVAV